MSVKLHGGTKGHVKVKKKAGRGREEEKVQGPNE